MRGFFIIKKIFRTAKALNDNPSDASIWQQIANNSSIVSESIKHLVAAIRDEAPGQADLDQAINILSQLIQQVDNAFMAAAHNEQPRVEATTESTHQQILHSLRQMLDIIDPLKIAVISFGFVRIQKKFLGNKSCRSYRS